ncbi:unnamed protein product [Lampetra planeri]
MRGGSVPRGTAVSHAERSVPCGAAVSHAERQCPTRGGVSHAERQCPTRDGGVSHAGWRVSHAAVAAACGAHGTRRAGRSRPVGNGDGADDRSAGFIRHWCWAAAASTSTAVTAPPARANARGESGLRHNRVRGGRSRLINDASRCQRRLSPGVAAAAAATQRGTSPSSGREIASCRLLKQQLPLLRCCRRCCC